MLLLEGIFVGTILAEAASYFGRQWDSEGTTITYKRRVLEIVFVRKVK